MLNDILQDRPEYNRGGFGILILVIDKWLIKMPFFEKECGKDDRGQAKKKNRHFEGIFNQ